MRPSNKRAKRSVQKTEPEATVPKGMQAFCIEMKWRFPCESYNGDPVWSPSAKKGPALGTRERTMWWPARITVRSVERNEYDLLYTRSPIATSNRDLDFECEYLIRFDPKGWIYHVKGEEKGKSCMWRNVKWEHSQADSNMKMLEEENEITEVHSRDIEELRGCYLELQNKFHSQDRLQLEKMERLGSLEKRIAPVLEPSDTDTLR